MSIRVQPTINHISIFTFLCFLPQNQRQRKCKNAIARHIDASSVVFDWFVLSMRMQVILDSLFARPGSAAIGGGKKGEYRDWIISIPTNFCLILSLPRVSCGTKCHCMLNIWSLFITFEQQGLGLLYET